MSDLPAPEPSLSSHMARGSAWTYAIRAFVRFSGLISTAILARLLTPSDYGIITISVVIVGSVEIFSQTGQHLAIIRMKDPTRAHYDSAFSIQILLHAALAAIMLLLMPLASLYFHEPRAEPVIALFALKCLMAGFQNIGILNFRRDLRFDRQFYFTMYPEIVATFVAIASGIYFRNYWALVTAIMVQQLADLILSYVLEPYRPRISFSKVHEIWGFSFWTLMRSIGTYLNRQVGKIAIGSFAGAGLMGSYNVGSELASIPVDEVVSPMMIVLFPVLSRAQADRQERNKLVLEVFHWTALICIPTSVGVAVVANDLIDLVLGTQWAAAKPLVPWFALAAGILGMTSSVYYSFETIGRPRTSASLQWLRFAALAVILVPVAYQTHSITTVAVSRFVVTLAVAPSLFIALGRAIGVRPWTFARIMLRPLLGGAFMAALVVGLNAIALEPGIIRFGIDILVGVCSFAVFMLTSWIALGRPLGPEREIVDFARERLRLILTWLRMTRVRLLGAGNE